MAKSLSTKSKDKVAADQPQRSLGALLYARRNDGLILLSIVATMATMAWIILNNPIGIADEWTWPTRVVIGARFWTPLPAVVLLITVAGILTRPNRWQKLRPRWRAVWLVGIFLIAWFLALGIVAMPQNSVLLASGIVASQNATSYFNVATEIKDLPQFLHDFPNLMAGFPLHARTHPPGPILFFWGVDQLMRAWPGLVDATERLCLRLDAFGTTDLTSSLNSMFGLHLARADTFAAIIAVFLLAGLGSLSVFPLYWLAAGLYNPTTAMRAVLLFATIPALSLFAPVIDQLVLLLAVLILWSFYRFRTKGCPWVGFFFAVGLLISVGLAVMGLFLALWWFLEWRSKQTPPLARRKFLLSLAGAVVLFIGTFVVLQAAVGLNYPAIVKAGLAAHRHETTEAITRTYWKWVAYNPVEVAVFLGMPLVVWSLWGVRGIFALAWVGTLVLLDVSGWVRAEAGRIWLFLMPPAAIIAAERLDRLGKRFDLGFFTALFLQLGQAITMKAGLDIFILK